MQRAPQTCVFVVAFAFAVGQAADASVWTSCHHYGKHDVQLTRPSADDLQMINNLMKVKQPDSLGRGRDIVGPHRPPYNNLKVLSVWKISENNSYVDSYIKRRDSLNQKHAGKTYWMPTYQDEVIKAEKSRGALGDNEYYMFHGESLSEIHRNLCRGSSYPGSGAFGKGIYLADCADKSDQYIVASNGNELKEILNGQQDELVPEGKDIALVFVTRAYFGHYVEQQKKPGHGYLWHDPETDRKEYPSSIQWHQFGVDMDSYKIMSTKLHRDFGGKGRGFPYRFDEFLIPDQPNNAFQYVVVYERVQEEPDIIV